MKASSSLTGKVRGEGSKDTTKKRDPLLGPFSPVESEFQSDLSTIQVRCRGCDYVAVHGAMSLQGEDVAIRIRGESCPQCEGRMQELFLQRLGRSKFRPVFR